MKSFRIPILISIFVHSILFLSIAWIRLDGEYEVHDKVSVALVEKKQERPQKRSIPTRKVPMQNQSIRYDIPTTSVNLSITNQPAYMTYSENSTPAFYENVAVIEYKGSDIIGDKGIAYRSISRPISTPTKDINIRRNIPKIDRVEGVSLITNKPLILEKPKVSFAKNDNEALQKYLEIVRKKIESNKRYPIFAMNTGIEGRCGVILTILSNGHLEKAEIADSSGNELLDNSALESVRNSAPFPSIPSEVGRDKINMSISLLFKLSQMGR